MYHAKLSSKGQTTIPKPVREALQLKPGDRIDFIVEENGRIVLRARNRRLEDFVGILKRPGQKVATLEDMDRGIAAAVAERHKRSCAGE
jgi:AbrB family looped-hinge helix DNA binding protein